MTIELFNQQQFKEDNIQQNWYRIQVDEFLLKPQNSLPIKTNKRAVGITLPLNYDKDKEYNYIINFDFNIDGKSSDWFQWEKNQIVGPMYTGFGGYIPFNKDTKLWYTKGQQTGFNYLMSLMKNLVNNNIVIIQLSMTDRDTYYFSECHKKDKKINNKYCWTPNNPDLNYFKHLFDVIRTNKFPIKLNFSDMAFLGYSVGSQAVSRYINEFPFLKTINGTKFPKIISAVLIAGGSYFCYDSYLHKIKPDNFKNCIDEINRGCCPNNIIEQNFHDGTLKWSDHPPVLLVQQSNDFFADPNASIYYFNIMSKNNAPVLRISDNSDTHGINSFQQSNQIFNFISNIFDLEDKQTINKNFKYNKLNIVNLILLIIFSILFFINIYMISKINNKFYYIMLLILIVIILFLSINLYKTSDNFKITNDILQNNRIKNNTYLSVINKEDIVKKINSNGILITMNSTKLYCPEFEETLLKCDDDKCNNYVSNCPLGRNDTNCKCLKSSQCTLFDVGNVDELLNYNLSDAGTSCFALDTTYLNQNLPPKVFGPYLSYNGLGESFPIGFILDFDNLKKNGYIACGYTFDAGSIGRTPPDAVINNIYTQKTADKCLQEALKITDDDLLNGKIHVGDKGTINKNNCPPTVMAGCLNYDSTYTPAKSVPNLNNLDTSVIQNCKDIPSEKCLTSDAFSDSAINPFFEFNDKGYKMFKEHATNIQSILGKQSRTTHNENNICRFYKNCGLNPNQGYGDDVSYPDYWAYQIGSNVTNQYTQKSIGWGGLNGKDGFTETEVDLFVPQKQGTNIKISCNPTEKFKKVWKDSILGIFTNNICYQDVKYNNAKDFWPKVNNVCCSSEFNNDLVRKLVDKFNSNSKRKINGYIIETVKPGTRIESQTNNYNYENIITQIT